MGKNQQPRIEHRRVHLGVRAPRPAVLFGSNCSWDDCIALVETLTAAWGGGTFAIIPTDGNSISPLFWKLLKLHDPDWFMQFADTVSVSDGLKQELLRRHSVALPWGGHVWHLWPDNIGYNLTSILDALPSGAKPLELSSVAAEAQQLVQLLIHATTGRFSDETKKELAKREVSIEERVLHFDNRDRWYDLSTDLWESLKPSRHTRYPFDLSSMHLGLYLRMGEDMLRHPLVAVCGSSVEDFAYFWTLRSLRALPLVSNVYWLPIYDQELVKRNRDYKRLWPWLAYGIAQTLDRVWGDKRVLVTSVSSGTEGLMRVGAALYAAMPATPVRVAWEGEEPQRKPADALPATVVAPDDLVKLVPYMASFWEEDNTPAANASIVQFLDGEAMAVLQTPMPSRVDFRFESKIQWIAEAIVDGLRVPTRPALTPLLVSGPQLASYRVSRDGVAFTAVSDFKHPGVPTRSLLVRPTLRLPGDWEVFEALCDREGLVAKPSDKGQYEREFIQKVGGLGKVAAELQELRIAKTLMKFIDQSQNTLGIWDEGVNIRGTRYLDLRALRKLWDGDDSAATAFANRYLQAGLFGRGLIIKCPFCRNADWYGMTKLSDRVVCHRCSREYIYDADANLYFRLDELVALALRNDSHVPLLGLEWFRRKSADSFLFGTACELRRKEVDDPGTLPWIEVDFWVVADGALVIGEAKRSGKLATKAKKQLATYEEFCQALRPKVFAVCTGAEGWDSGSKRFLEHLAASVRKLDVELQSLTGGELGWPLATETA